MHGPQGGVWGNNGRLSTTGWADAIVSTSATLPTDIRVGIQCFRADGTSVSDTSVISVNPIATGSGAQTSQTTLSAVCAGASANTGTYTVNWSVIPKGGQAPYQYAWSLYNQYLGFGADGTTSSQSFTTKYSTTGSKSALVRITDARGTIVNTTCSSVIPELTTGGTGTNMPVIYSVTPGSGTPPLIAKLTGANLTGASVINFNTASGQFAGSATTNNVTATSLYFMVPNLPAGQYLISVVTSSCKAGCGSNKIGFTVTGSNTT